MISRRAKVRRCACLTVASLLATIELSAMLEARARFRPEVIEAGEAVLFEVTITGDDRLPSGTPAFPESFLLTVVENHYTLRTSSRAGEQAWSQLTWKSFPTEAGTYSVGGELMLDGERFEIAPAVLKVLPVRPWLRNQLELRFAASRKNPFAGEKVPTEVELRVQADVAVMLPQRPAIDGRGVLIDPPGDFISTQPSTNWELQKVFAWPTSIRTTREGRLPLRAQMVLRWEDPTPHSGRRRSRSSGYGRREFTERLITSEPFILTTRSLPIQPEGFSGLIGDWDLRSEFDQPAIREDESVRWILSLEGIGAGATTALLPILENTEEWQVSGPSVVKTESGVRFEYLLDARSIGMQLLPIARLEVFEPRSESFRILQTQPESIPVAAAPIHSVEATPPVANSGSPRPLTASLSALAGLSLILAAAGIWHRLRRPGPPA